MNETDNFADYAQLSELLTTIKTYIDDHSGGGGGGGIVVQTTAPSSTNVLWIDISGGDTKGVPKYYINGAWTPCQSVWG